MMPPAPEQPKKRKRSASQRGEAVESRLTPALVLQAMRQWWKAALPAALLLIVAGSAFVLLTFEPQYEAVAWLRIDERPTYVAFETRNEERWTYFVNTQRELLHSPLVLLPVVRQADVAALPELQGQVDPVLWMGKKLAMKSVGDSELFKLSIATPHRDSSARLVNAVLDSYFTLRNGEENSRGERVISLLEEERQRRAEEVAQLRASVQSLVKQSGGVIAANGTTGPDPAQAALVDLQNRLVSAEVEAETLKARLRAAEELAAAPRNSSTEPISDAAVEQNPEVRRLLDALTAKQTKLADIKLRSALGDQDPAHRQLREEIGRDEQAIQRMRAESRRQLPAAAGAVGGGRRPADEVAVLRSELDGRVQAARFLRERYEKQVRELKQADRDPLAAAAQRGALERAERTLEVITERLTRLRTEQRAPGRVSLMQRAEPPLEPLEAKPVKRLALVWLGGLLLPFGAAVAWERLVRRVTSAESLEQELQLPILAEVPRLSVPPCAVRRQSVGCSGLELELFEESVDTLRSSLFLSEEYRDLKWLAVTSAVSGEGKSSVSAQLAVSLARATGGPILLIDGDMRAPDVHSLFGTRLEPGLAETLTGQCPLDEAIVTTINEAVHVLPAGKLTTNPHRLLGKRTMPSLLAELGARYRHVIIDTPPVLAAGEALAMAQAAEVCILCTMYSRSRISQAIKARQRLEGVNVQVAGVVLSGVSGRQYAYRYGDYYAPRT